MVNYDLAPYHRSPLLFTIFKMLAIIIDVFLSYEQSPGYLECCCTIPLMSAARVSQMVYHWLPCCYAQTTCTPIQLKASMRWKKYKPSLFILMLLHLALTFLLFLLLLHIMTDEQLPVLFSFLKISCWIFFFLDSCSSFINLIWSSWRIFD